MAKIFFQCPKCGKKYQADEALGGRTIACKHCEAKVSILATDPGTDAPPSTQQTESPKPALDSGERPAGKFTLVEEIPPLWVPGDQILDIYEVGKVTESRPFAEGGMGRVYRVHHRGWNLDLAVKSPLPKILSKPNAVENFEREAERWVQLGLHPHIVSCYYVRRLGGIPRIFAEFVEGGTLLDWIRSGKLYEGGPDQALERILDIAIQIAWGLHFGHEQDPPLIHQDVKPANVMMTLDGIAKVTDFGLAEARSSAGEDQRDLTPGQTRLIPGAGMCTPEYASPEQLARQPLSRRTDIWSWAVTVLHMFVRDLPHPFIGVAAPQLLEKYACDEEPQYSESLTGIHPSLRILLRICFSKSPEDRYKTFLEIAKMLEDAFFSIQGKPYMRETPIAGKSLPDSLNNRAVSLMDLAKVEESEALLRVALTHDPLHLEATFNQSMLQWENGRLQDLEVISKLRENAERKQTWSSWYFLAQAHMTRGECKQTLACLSTLTPEDHCQKEVQALAQQARSGIICTRQLLHIFQGPVERLHALSWGLQQLALCQGPRNHTKQLAPGRFVQEPRRVFWLWDILSGKVLASYDDQSQAEVVRCPFFNDGRIAISLTKLTTSLWDTRENKCLITLPCSQFGEVVSKDRQILIDSGKRKDTKSTSWHGHSVATSLDGQLALLIDKGDDSPISVYDLTTGRRVRQLDTHTATCVTFSPNGKHALSGEWYGSLKLFDVTTGKCLGVFPGHTEWVRSVCIHRNGRLALSGSNDQLVKLWDLQKGRCLFTFEGHTKGVTSVCFSDDGTCAISTSYDDTARSWYLSPAWNHAAPAAIAKPTTSQTAAASTMRFTDKVTAARKSLELHEYAEAATLLRGARSLMGFERSPEAIDLWSSLYPHLRHSEFRGAWEVRDSPLEGTWFDKSGILAGRIPERLALFSSAGNMAFCHPFMWELNAGQINKKQVKTIPGASWPNAIAISRNGRILWANYFMNDVFYDAESGDCLRVARQMGPAGCIHFTADTRYAYVVDTNSVSLWDTVTSSLLRRFPLQTHASVHERGRSRADIAFSSDDHFLVSSNQKSLIVWDLASGKPRATLGSHDTSVLSVALSAEDCYVVSGTGDGIIKVWDLRNGQCIANLEGHQGSVGCVCFTRDGRFVLSGSDDTTVKLWEVQSGKCLHTFRGHKEKLDSIALSPDGGFALSASFDSIRLWQLDWELESDSPVEWHDKVSIFLEKFLLRSSLFQGQLSSSGNPFAEEVIWALTPRLKLAWTESAFNQLLFTLGCAGFGSIASERIRRELNKMASEWKAPPTFGPVMPPFQPAQIQNEKTDRNKDARPQPKDTTSEPSAASPLSERAEVVGTVISAKTEPRPFSVVFYVVGFAIFMLPYSAVCLLVHVLLRRSHTSIWSISFPWSWSESYEPAGVGFLWASVIFALFTAAWIVCNAVGKRKGVHVRVMEWSVLSSPLFLLTIAHVFFREPEGEFFSIVPSYVIAGRCLLWTSVGLLAYVVLLLTLGQILRKWSKLSEKRLS